MRPYDPILLLAIATFGVALPVFAFDTRAEIQTAPAVPVQISADTPPPAAPPPRVTAAQLAMNGAYVAAAAEDRFYAEAARRETVARDASESPVELVATAPERPSPDRDQGDIAVGETDWQARVAEISAIDSEAATSAAD